MRFPFPGINKKQGFYALLEKQAQAAVDAAKEFQVLPLPAAGLVAGLSYELLMLVGLGR